MTNESMAGVGTGSLTGPYGLSDPSLAIGLTTPHDWGPGMQFLDIMKMAREFEAHRADGSRIGSAELQTYDVFDENGWPKEIPSDLASIDTIWAWGRGSDQGLPAAEDRAGVYVLEYEGEGQIDLGLYANVLSSEPGRIVFENAVGGVMTMLISETDPNGVGDYIRDVTIVRSDWLDLHNAGAVFNPEWIGAIDDARQLRFMDWMQTNNSTQSEWADRPTADMVTYTSTKGVPVEIMVRLANEAGVDPWFNMPHLATDEYVREFATYVRDNLDPGLQATIEYSNEVWNPSFRQHHEVIYLNDDVWPSIHAVDSYSKRATEIALIWDEVYEGEQDHRLFKVLGAHGVNSWYTGRMLTNQSWRDYEPESYVDPSTVFDGVATATYFGGRMATDPVNRAGLDAAIADPDVDAFDWMRDRILNDPELFSSVPFLIDIIARHRAEIDALNPDIRLLSYEGGQHVHHLYATNGAGLDYTEFFTDFVRSEQMAEIYEAQWELWKEIGDGPYMQFGDFQTPSKWGSWGLYSHLGDENPRGTVLEELNEATPAWWEDRGGEHFQQGVTRRGDDENNRIAGTSQEDYLLGGAGNDTLIGGAGDDGINGGSGVDYALYDGRFEDFAIEQDGEGVRVTGADGSDYLYAVEWVRFDNAEVDITSLTPPVDDDDISVIGGSGDGERPLYVEMTSDDGPLITSSIGEDVGVSVNGVATTELLGQELSLGNWQNAYVVHAQGATADFGDQLNVSANYFSINANVADRGGVLLSESALVTASTFGGVYIGAISVIGTDHADRFIGRDADDRFYGGDGNDLFRTSGGDDLVQGGGGSDRITVGSGADFVVFGEGDGRDTVFDFSREDVLILSGFDGPGPYGGAEILENGRGLTLDFGGGDSILLRGHDEESLASLSIFG